MNDYDIEKLKEEFWEKIRPRTQEEIDNEAMIVKVREHFDKLIDELIYEGHHHNQTSKAKRLKQIKEEMDAFTLNLNNS